MWSICSRVGWFLGQGSRPYVNTRGKFLGELGMTDKEIENLSQRRRGGGWRSYRIKRANGRYGYYFECLPGISEHLLRMRAAPSIAFADDHRTGSVAGAV